MNQATESNRREEFQFQAEMSQLLHLITHSLYNHREIFLRELISNASDALSKLHFASLTKPEILGEDGDLKILIHLDEDQKTITITDNGVGMTKEELIQNIGTIASSGTSRFLKEMTGDKAKDLELIGRFGVGFYSVFMVAEEVTLTTRSFQDSQGYKWVSTGTGNYSIENAEDVPRGTSISFKFKPEAFEFASKWKIKNIIKKYSDFVSFPILMDEEKANQSNALWIKPKTEIKEEEYKEFFKYLTNAWTDPMTWLHLNAEGDVQFKSILFIPQEPDNQLFSTHLETKLHLYVKRVFIQNDCKDLLPGWLRFVSGVVDSEDLDLNVSRESTQQSQLMEKINGILVKKLLGEFKSWAQNDKEKYDKFFEQFGNFIKEGIHGDYANREKLVELYRAYSSQDPEKLTSLQEYLDRMKPDQKDIYFVAGKNKEAIEANPNLEYFKKHGLEVLYLYSEIDEFIMPALGPYKEKNLVSIDQAELAGEEEEDPKKGGLAKAKKEELLAFFKKQLGDLVEDVVESKRLVDSPCTLVAPKDGMNANMERMMKMMDKNFTGSKRVLEINTKNSLIKNLSKIQQENSRDSLLKECVQQLYETAKLQEGSLEDPSKLASRAINIMDKAASLLVKSLKDKAETNS